MDWTINGNSTFKTYIGAFISLMVMSVVLAFSVKEFFDMYTFANPDIKSYSQMINLSDPEHNSYTPADSHFNIGLGLRNGNPIPPEIGSFEAFYITSTKDKNNRSKREIDKKNLNMVECKYTKWHISDSYKE